jgi:hypothetical protein
VCNLKADKIKSFIGKPIIDIHKRNVGRIIGYYANTKNEVTSVEVELAHGEFVNSPISQIEITGDSIYYIQPWELEAEALKKQFDLIVRRIKALDELRRNGDMDGTIFEDLHQQHSNTIEELKEQRDVLLDSLQERTDKINNQIKELEIFLANSKMQHQSGEIDDEAYQIAYEAVNQGLNKAISEKNYLKELADFLKNVESSASQINEDEETSSNVTPIKKIPDIVYIKMKEEAA